MNTPNTPEMLCRWQAYENVANKLISAVNASRDVERSILGDQLVCLMAACTERGYPAGYTPPDAWFENDVWVAFQTELQRLYPNDRRLVPNKTGGHDII